MQDNQAGTWLARDGDGRVLEVDLAGHPGGEATPGDGRPVAEAAEPGLLMGPPRAGKAAGARQLEAEAG
jgi:hypothetical protein